MQHTLYIVQKSWVSISTDFWARFPLSTTFFQRKAKKSRQGNALARERVLFQERVLFLGQEGGGSGMLFNRVNSLNRATSLTRVITDTVLE